MILRVILLIVGLMSGCLGICEAQTEDRVTSQNMGESDIRIEEVSDRFKKSQNRLSSSQQGSSRELEIEKTLERYTRELVLVTEKSEILTERDVIVQRALDEIEQAQVKSVGEVLEFDIGRTSEQIRSKPPVTIRGQLRNEVAARLYDSSQVTKLKNQVSLTGTGEVIPSVRYRVSGRAYYDAVYDLQNNYSESASSDQRLEAELRETYVDFSWGDWDLRVGKQQVVWGEAIALFVADVVNAKDLREFILPDFDSIRIPEWGMSLEHTNENLNSQLIVLPGIEFNKLGVVGSEFAFPLPVTAGTPITYSDAKAPKDSLENSKIGTRFSYLWEGIDVGVFYLHSWTLSPVEYRRIDSGVYHFMPDYERLDTYGATFSKEVRDVVFKGDFVYTKDDYFATLDPADSDGVFQSSRFDYLLGADYTFFDRLDVSFQFSQRIIQDEDDSMFAGEKYDSAFSLRLSREFWNRKLFAEFMMVYGMAAPDFMYRPKLRYNLTNNLQMSIGVDIFSGQPSGIFGYFRDQSRYYSELVCKF